MNDNEKLNLKYCIWKAIWSHLLDAFDKLVSYCCWFGRIKHSGSMRGFQCFAKGHEIWRFHLLTKIVICKFWSVSSSRDWHWFPFHCVPVSRWKVKGIARKMITMKHQRGAEASVGVIEGLLLNCLVGTSTFSSALAPAPPAILCSCLCNTYFYKMNVESHKEFPSHSSSDFWGKVYSCGLIPRGWKGN